MGLGVVHAHAGEAGAELIVVVRGHLAKQVGVEEEIVAARGCVFGCLIQQRVGTDTGLFGVPELGGSEYIPIPLVGGGAAARSSAGIPEPGYDMAVVKELAAFDRRVGYDAYAPGGGELYRGAAWRYGSGGVDLQGGVRCSDQYGRTLP